MPIPSLIRRLLRPSVYFLRRSLRRLNDVVRPLLPWDGAHHPVLDRFPPFCGEADGKFSYDSFGVKTDPRFRPQLKPSPAGPLSTSHPEPYAPYFELVFVLESVAEAGDSYTMVELGAGYGPWMVTAHQALQQLGPRPVRLVGVEMVPHHFEWMHDHFRNNGIDPAGQRLIHAAVSDAEGEAIYMPEKNPLLDFGQSLLQRGLPTEGTSPAGGARIRGDRPVRVPCIVLGPLLSELDAVDMMHVDIQGEELRVLTHAAEAIDDKVRRLFVATHSRAIHRRLRQLMIRLGWRIVYDFDYRKRVRTPFGDVQFLDGLLACLNPKRASQRERM